MSKTKIPWCDATWNPIAGLDKPLHWRNPRRVFVCSMGDLFHPSVEIGFLTHVFDTIEQCPQHTFQILTKRPENISKLWTNQSERPGHSWQYMRKGTVLPNVWLGTSCENQEWYDKRWPIAAQIPAAVNFISFEPLLSDIQMKPPYPSWCIICAESKGGHPGRECKIEWVRSIVQQCKAAGIPVFVKQIHMWETWCNDLNRKILCETEFDAAQLGLFSGHKPKCVLLKYPRDKDLFPKDLQVWEWPK